jgi:methylated-DNA-[protein]-cysteine S-methyltransferase
VLPAATGPGMARIDYPAQDHGQVLAQVAERISRWMVSISGRLDAAIRELEEYFSNRRRVFDCAGPRLSAEVRRAVLSQLPWMAYSETESYTVLRWAKEGARAIRAVGTACATDPLPVVLPRLRVVRSDGSHGGCPGGPAARHILLAFETRGDIHATGATGRRRSGPIEARPSNPGVGGRG